MENYTILASRKRIMFVTLLSVVFLLLGAVFILFTVIAVGSGNSDINVYIVGVVGVVVVLIFLLCLLYYVKTLIAGKPAVVISNEGIFDNSSYLAAGLIKWEEIDEIALINYQKQILLGITTYDANLIIDRTQGFKRMLYKINKKLIDTQVNIPVKTLACSIEELIEMITEKQTAHEKESR
ncbi:STM3941 family protein [Paenibacillus monticola]|uniref:Uncharacterized protein n=1 Tax=Paenibacillus monticola TaxID=2666075 RepID=A0A7X2HAC1_9BACL|nr:STM3941 family protein [Paenibacillus monticola]MRN56311.1 hypothetical protein [Paenibacillus monticola]